MNSVRDGRPSRTPSPLVGRTSILATLAGERAVVLRGEPGSGKSRLLAEARARDEAPMVATVRVHRGVAAPFEPIESLVAALRRRVGAAAPSTAVRAADGRDRLVALREALESLAATAPLLLQIDDIHRASPAALDAIAYCVDRTEDSAIRWQFAARPGSDVDRVWEDMARDGVLQFVDVPPLDELETQTLARAIASDAPEDLYRSTGGNPLYIEHLASSGEGVGAGGLRVLLENRMRELPSEPARIAAMLAVARRPLEAGALERASTPGSPELVRPALASLETAGIIRVGADGVDFAHDLLREACVGLLSVPQIRELHAALATLPGSDLERAEHLLGAGRPDEARDVYLAAARSALDALAYAEASSLLSRMNDVGLLPSHATWETRALAAVTTAFFAGGAPSFPAELARRDGVDPGVAVVYLRAFLPASGRPEFEGARAAVASALGDPAIPISDRTTFQVFHAKALFNQYQFVEALAATAPQHGDSLDSPARLDQRSQNALFHGLVHDVAEGREMLMALAVDSDARALSNFPCVFSALATLEQMSDNAPGLLYWAKIGMEWAGGTIEARRFFHQWAYGALNSGRVAEVLESCVAARAFYSRRGIATPAVMLAVEGEAAAWIGDADRIEREFDERDVSSFSDHDRACLALNHGMLAEFRGALDVAQRRYRRVLELTQPPVSEPSVALVLLTRIAALQGDRESAEALAESCLRLGSWDGPYVEACLFYASLTSGDANEMRARCELALVDLPYLERAIALGLLGERARDRDALAASIEMFDAAGAIRQAERFRESARALGFRPGSAKPARPVLTPREGEIVRLVAEGMTNREIAAQLHVSPKTIAAGVSAVLEKCGMSSRVDIAARVASGRGFERVGRG